MKCEDCVYWAGEGPNSPYGECRLKPPVLVKLSSHAYKSPTNGETSIHYAYDALFPRIEKTKWCGAFENKHLQRDNLHNQTGYDS
jgi:hypothetical protein